MDKKTVLIGSGYGKVALAIAEAALKQNHQLVILKVDSVKGVSIEGNSLITGADFKIEPVPFATVECNLIMPKPKNYINGKKKPRKKKR